MKVPVESSIYWDSVDSQQSTSGGSSGDACSSSSRHYVDPWDLENYAYLRRHSVAGLTQQATRQHQHQHQHRQQHHHHRRASRQVSHDPRARSEHRCASSLREPGYDAPGFVEELYCGPPRQTNNACYYHQAIYEDEAPDYVGSFPVYAPLSEIRHAEEIEEQRNVRHRCKSVSMRDLDRVEYMDQRTYNPHVRELDVPRHRSECRSMTVNSTEERYTVETPPQRHLDLNTYGHLKIDYANSWNSLNRKISK